MTGLTEAQVRQIVREENSVLLAAMMGFRVSPDTGELIPFDQLPEGYDLAFQGHDSAEQRSNHLRSGHQPTAGPHCFDSDAVDNGLGDRQVIGDLVVPKADELHASPSLVGDLSVGDGPESGAR